MAGLFNFKAIRQWLSPQPTQHDDTLAAISAELASRTPEQLRQAEIDGLLESREGIDRRLAELGHVDRSAATPSPVAELAAARGELEYISSLHYDAHDEGWVEEHREMEAAAAGRVKELESKKEGVYHLLSVIGEYERDMAGMVGMLAEARAENTRFRSSLGSIARGDGWGITNDEAMANIRDHARKALGLKTEERIAELEAKFASPPVPEGMTRLYHPGAEPIHDSAWFTSSKAYAEQFAAQTRDKALQYVDIPTDHPLIEPSWPDQTLARGFTWIGELPADLATQARRLHAEGPQPLEPLNRDRQRADDATRESRLFGQKGHAPEPGKGRGREIGD